MGRKREGTTMKAIIQSGFAVAVAVGVSGAYAVRVALTADRAKRFRLMGDCERRLAGIQARLGR